MTRILARREIADIVNLLVAARHTAVSGDVLIFAAYYSFACCIVTTRLVARTIYGSSFTRDAYMIAHFLVGRAENGIA